MTATYRLQLHPGFTFEDAARAVPYVADLGATHLYLSPVLQAAPGSTHGYDVVDHTRVSAELGGQRGLEALSDRARQHGLGLVVDLVPNHMALAPSGPANPVLWRLLAEGPESGSAAWFDVDWAAGAGRLGLPLLERSLAETLAEGWLMLAEHEGQQVIRYDDHLFPVAKGTGSDDPADVAAVLDRQHYRLAGWRERDTVLNYRRFLDIDGLIAIRVEDEEVFAATHRVLLALNQRGVIEGFRIDHPDGLADPEAYLRRLRQATRLGTAVWVEKVLEGDERLPATWLCEGTTGYDALRAVTAALIDPTTAPLIGETWEAAGGEPELGTVLSVAKHTVLNDLLRPERDRLTRRAQEACPESDPHGVADAVTELLLAGDVYRAYARPHRPASEDAVARLEAARARAVAERPDLAEAIGRLVRIATRPSPSSEPEADFAVRLQQTWGAVMAKGVEDTAFYRWHRMVALNEVGGDPDLLDRAAPEILHAWAEHQQQHWPLGMSTLSTHDTKRSEDVRARLIAFAGDAESWALCAEAFGEAADSHGVDRPTAQLVWQTLVGVGDIQAERLRGYLVKAVREAKLHTAWTDGDRDYEQRVLDLAAAAVAPGHLRALLDTALDHNREAIRAAILGQKLLQLTLPGVPDTYQGSEVVQCALVDPDNRRPVDYAARAKRLGELADLGPRDLDDEKLLVTTRTLALRRELRQCFGDAGRYAPVPATSRHVVAFTRGGEVATLVTRAHQRLQAAGGWADTTVTLADGLWRDELTATLHEGGSVRCADVFEQMPVALLRRVHI